MKNEHTRETAWPVLEKADDRTALLLADSHPEPSAWSRDTVFPWLLTRNWTNGTEPARILREGAISRARIQEKIALA